MGIVAGKIMNQTGKPTIVLGIKEDGTAKGSGRSVEALNLFEMLDQMRDLFTLLRRTSCSSRFNDAKRKYHNITGEDEPLYSRKANRFDEGT